MKLNTHREPGRRYSFLRELHAEHAWQVEALGSDKGELMRQVQPIEKRINDPRDRVYADLWSVDRGLNGIRDDGSIVRIDGAGRDEPTLGEREIGPTWLIGLTEMGGDTSGSSRRLLLYDDEVEELVDVVGGEALILRRVQRRGEETSNTCSAPDLEFSGSV